VIIKLDNSAEEKTLSLGLVLREYARGSTETDANLQSFFLLTESENTNHIPAYFAMLVLQHAEID